MDRRSGPTRTANPQPLLRDFDRRRTFAGEGGGDLSLREVSVLHDRRKHYRVTGAARSFVSFFAD
jgi:hypothetical protein